MRYRRSSYRYAAMVGSSQTWIVGDVWRSDLRLRLAQSRWRPDVDAYETATTLEVVVDLAGVEEDDFEVQLFEDALVVEGDRRLSAPKEMTMYHAASIRQGPFRVEVILPKPIDAEHVEAHYEHGILRISLPKRAGVR
jgi:HSP20 family molecular chaperone IbpA